MQNQKVFVKIQPHVHRLQKWIDSLQSPVIKSRSHHSLGSRIYLEWDTSQKGDTLELLKKLKKACRMEKYGQEGEQEEGLQSIHLNLIALPPTKNRWKLAAGILLILGLLHHLYASRS